MTVDELCYLYIEPTEEMTVYDIESGKDIFVGTFDDARDEYGYYEVESFGIERGKICINISVE